jgi:GNAT superfamily N-acetyltransferase
MEIAIRLATVADMPVLAELRRELTFEDPEPAVELRSDFARIFDEVVGAGIASGRWTVWVGEADGRIASHVYVGLIEKIPRPTREARWIGYVTNVYTRPEHRGRGIGAALLDRVTSWAAEKDVELLVVWPSEESVSFYERAGFSSGRDPLVWERA